MVDFGSNSDGLNEITEGIALIWRSLRSLRDVADNRQLGVVSDAMAELNGFERVTLYEIRKAFELNNGQEENEENNKSARPY